MICQLMDMWQAAREDESVRIVVLTGAGDRAFSAGADLKLTVPLLTGERQPETEFDQRLLDTPDWTSQVFHRNCSFHKPVVAAVNGLAIAGGFEALMASDIRIASSNAMFGVSEVKIGIMAHGGTVARLPKQIPWCEAMEILLTGEPITAERAKEIGLINRIVDPQNLYEEVDQIVERLKKNSPLSLQAIKRTAVMTAGMELDQSFQVETKEGEKLLTTDDAKEGPRAFAEKRQPLFRGL
jgi:enoyl-CoA hydratase